MPGSIYVEIGKIDVSKAPKDYADTASKAMEAAASKAISGDRDLTGKKGEGYTMRMKIAELQVDAGSATCQLSGELVRYPKAEMVSTSISSSAKADGGKPDSLVKDCVAAAAEAMMKKVIPVMKKQART
jgi:hypothetical protein